MKHKYQESTKESCDVALSANQKLFPQQNKQNNKNVYIYRTNGFVRVMQVGHS